MVFVLPDYFYCLQWIIIHLCATWFLITIVQIVHAHYIINHGFWIISYLSASLISDKSLASVFKPVDTFWNITQQWEATTDTQDTARDKWSHAAYNIFHVIYAYIMIDAYIMWHISIPYGQKYWQSKDLVILPRNRKVKYWWKLNSPLQKSVMTS